MAVLQESKVYAIEKSDVYQGYKVKQPTTCTSVFCF